MTIEEKKDDNQGKTDAFLKEYGELRTKYKRDFISYPVYVPNDKGVFELKIQLQIVDISKESVKSPFIA